MKINNESIMVNTKNLKKDKKCFVVHGGIPLEDVDIRDIPKFNFSREKEPLWEENRDTKLIQQL